MTDRRKIFRLRMMLSAAALLAACGRAAPFPAEDACRLGGYEMADGRVMGLAPREGAELRYVFLTGETGAVKRSPEGTEWRAANDAPGGAVRLKFGDCESGSVEFFGPDAAGLKGARIPYKTTETIFDGVDGKRAGRLVLPADGAARAIVVSVHGSERWSGRVGERLQTLMPAYGIGVFAYDKRGTGESAGKYTQDFEILAGDAVLAAREARRLYGADVPMGFWGGSQGGWVGPLAAVKGGADFVIAAYGMAESPLAEDREEVFAGLRRAGYGEDVIAKAREITDATGRVMASDLKEGFAELSAVREKYKREPWFKEIDGEFSGDFMRTPNWLIRIVGPFFDVGTSWDYDPRPTLEAIEAPHLWILADRDRDAPHERTLEILREIQRARSNLDIVVFPNTDHGIYEFVEAADGERIPTRFAPGYYALIRDFVLTGIADPGVEGPVVYKGSEAGGE